MEISKKNTSLYFFCSSRSLIDMRNDVLIKFLKSNKNYCFRIGEYIIPIQVRDFSGVHLVNLRNNRESNINSPNSKWVRYFEVLLSTFYTNYRYLKEFPLIIEDRNMWGSICRKTKITEEDYLHRNYFLTDYFFPEYNLAVEIDSDLHDQEYDKARDFYIKSNWGIDIIRMYEFGETPENMKRNIDLLNSRLLNNPQVPTEIDYSSSILDYFYSTLTPAILGIFNKLEYVVTTLKPGSAIKLDSRILSKFEIHLLRISNLYPNLIINYFKQSYGITVIWKP